MHRSDAGPRIGVVLLNWNGLEDTIAALDSLAVADPRPASVVVVDNASTQDPTPRVAHWATDAHVRVSVRSNTPPNGDVTYPNGSGEENEQTDWLRVIRVYENRGFAGGNNVGLEYLANQTDVTHFLLLNNDAQVAPDYFVRISEALAQVPDAALMGCAIYHYPDTERVWYAGGYEDRRRGVSLHNEYVPADERPLPTEFVTGCAMLISRDTYQRIGPLPECYYPAYCEDTEYSHLARQTLKPVVWAPAARVYHRVGASAGRSDTTPRVAYWQARHRVFYIRRNYAAVDRCIALSYLCVVKPVRAAAEIARGRPEMGRAIMRGLYRGLIDVAGP